MLRHKYTIFLFLLSLLGVMPVMAQTQNKVEVVQDPLIAVLQQFRAGKGGSNASAGNTEPVDRSNLTRSTARGFRVQIYMGPSRSSAYAEQARFLRMFRNIDTYISYDEPNYRVKVGDFTSRHEAEQLLQGLRDQFTNVFLFNEEIFVYH